MCNKQPSITATDLVLDLLATHETHELSVAALCRAAAVFTMTEQSVRVALTRLVQQGKVVSSARGLYAWNPSGSSLFRDVESWLRKEQRAARWKGGWIGVVDAAVARRNRTVWRQHERALALRGFRRLEEGLHLRPDNLKGGVSALRHDLVSLGLAPKAVVFGVHDLAPEQEQRARELWDIAGLRKGYRELYQSLERSESRLNEVTLEQAAAETLLLGRAAIRYIIHDPLLPEALMPGHERIRLIGCMRRYQQRALSIWMEILRGA